ncbi:hypothetical protein KSF78_0009106 [Schistosoma japonicum]|nr:hypothetical protein KSF78_0009106 [Schistosoma japonicum]
MSKSNLLHHLQGIHSMLHHHASTSTDEVSLNDEIHILNYLLDNKQKLDYMSNENTFLSYEDNEIWTLDWLQKHLDVLTELSQLLLKHSKNCSIHVNIDEILPITRLWRSYLQVGLTASSSSSSPSSSSSSSSSFIECIPEHADNNVNDREIYFYWDMYIVLRKLNHYQIKPYTTYNQSITHIPSYYYIITSMISSEKTETNIESSKSKDFTDQYELFRSNEHVEMKSQLDQWNFISTEKICQVIFSTVLQECLNAALLNDSGQLSMKIISWRCLFDDNIDKAIEMGYFPIEIVFDLKTLGNNSFYYSSKLWKHQHIQHNTPLLRRIQLIDNKLTKTHSVSSTPSATATMTTAIATTTTTAIATTTTSATNLLIIRIRFHPVYSFNEFINCNTLKLSTLFNTSNYQSNYYQHNFLKITYIKSINKESFQSKFIIMEYMQLSYR